MEVNRKDLLAALNIVKNAVADKEILEQSDSFIFDGGTVHAFNDDIAISTDSPLDVNGAVKAKELLAFLNKCSDETLKVKTSPSELRLQGKRFRAGLRLASEILLPLKEIAIAGKWKDLPGNFSQALKVCVGSCSRDMSKPALTCINLSGEVAEACDSEQITVFTFEKNYFPKQVLLPYYAAAVLAQIDPQTYSVGKGWVHFGYEDKHTKLTVACRVFQTTYPDIAQYTKFKGEKINLPKTLPEMLDRAQIFSVTDIKHRTFTDVAFKDGKCIVSAKNNNGWTRETTKLKYDGDAIHFKINPTILRDIAKRMDKVIMNERSMRFKGTDYVHCVSVIPAGKED